MTIYKNKRFVEDEISYYESVVPQKREARLREILQILRKAREQGIEKIDQSKIMRWLSSRYGSRLDYISGLFRTLVGRKLIELDGLHIWLKEGA